MPPIDPRSDPQLIDAIEDGDWQAFAALYYRHRDWVVRLGHRLTGNHDDALDVLQETFYGSFPAFQLRASFTAFL